MERRKIKILLVEDNTTYAKLITDILSLEKNPPFHIEGATTLKESLERLAKGGIDLVLLDLSLPDSQGLETFDRIQSQSPLLPIVVLTGLDDQRIAIEIVRKGGQDYLVKGRVDGSLLASIIRHAIERKQAERVLKRAHIQTGQLLSSLTSILIGISPEGFITHWNTVAETTFGISASEVLGQPFSKCGVKWNAGSVLTSLEECRKKNRPLRLEDIRFQGHDGLERLLGFTLIPISGETEGSFEFLLFGADITARKQAEQIKNEFVSTVSHEFRTPLAIIKEGVSQVYEGVCGQITQTQRDTLKLSLEAIDRLGRIVEELLDISKIESGRIELRRELVDIVSLAKMSSLAFSSQTKAKGIQIKLNAPQDRLEIYADKDKVTQIFTNLMGNAIKFTEKGHIGISILDKGNGIECCVSDTGKGIAKEDIPKVFSKFEQFAREIGPGPKGTGLGLAICKGLIEAHRGKIWIESELGKGTRITFLLPKYTARELFKEYLGQHLKESVSYGAPLSLIIFELKDFDKIRKKIGNEQALLLVQDLESLVKQNLHRKSDLAIKNTDAVFVVLPTTEKSDALTIAEKIQQSYEKDLAKNSLGNDIKLACKVAGFPEDGNTEESLLNQTQL